MSQNSDERPPLLIVGVSTRAAAHSALRGGLRPICVDHFGDVDLQSAARVVTVPAYPTGLLTAVEMLPAAPWIYTGGLENHPQIVAGISARRTLLGNGVDVLTRVRNPWWLAAQLQGTGLPALPVWPPDADPPPRDGTWVCKPRRGAGGRGIRIWEGSSPAPHEPVWFQRRASGEAYSAQFLGTRDGAILLGITRQLIGLPEVAAPPFAWCGAITTTSLTVSQIETMRQIGERLADEARLWGLFGCDFIVEGDTPWLTEVNPRYTAAMELLDHQWGLSLIDWHCQACASNDPGMSNSKSEISNLKSEISNLKFQISDLRSQIPDRRTDRCFGKIILFADRDLIAGDARHLLRPPCDDGLPNVADLPPPGQHISAGQPVCSLFASDDTEAGCRARLLEFALTFRERFTRSS